jgi:hypothetical protein
MDHETQRLTGAARVPGGAPETEGPPAGPVGTPTTYLPPITPPAPGVAPGPYAQQAEAGAPGGYLPPAAGPAVSTGGPAGSYTPPPAPGLRMARYGGGGRLVPFALIALGFVALSGGFHAVFASAFPLALGLIFLYVSMQGPGRLGFRIPGCILTGLGAGVVVDSMGMFGCGGYAALGLGLGFVALWALDRGQWWWLIPGAAVGLGGLQSVVSCSGFGHGAIYPLGLIAFGAFLLMNRGRRARA